MESDIERVARLRGRDPANYHRASTTLETVANRIGRQSIRNAFALPDDWRLEMKVFDHLPMASRIFLREAPVAVSSIKWSELLEAADYEQQPLMDLFSQVFPLRVADMATRHYGPKHPQASVA